MGFGPPPVVMADPVALTSLVDPVPAHVGVARSGLSNRRRGRGNHEPTSS
jgi:hypothetical protein